MPRKTSSSLARVIALCLTAPALIVLPAPLASAQTRVQTEAAAVAAGLAAQYEAALIRERRLADDRETRLLEDAEARLRQARQRADARAAGAEAALAEARTAYATLCAEVTSREASLHAEIEAYRAEALGLATRATPERLAALQRFADGDRVGAWPVIEELMQASVRARMAAASGAAAAEVRDVAGLRAIMRANGEATSAQVLQLWDQAAGLDPRDLDTQLERAVLLVDLGQLPQARAAAESALALASDDDDRARVNTELGRIAIDEGDLARAKTTFEAQLPYLRQRVQAEPTGDNRRNLVVALNNLGDVLTRQGDPNAAYRAYHEALGLTLQLSREEPNSQLLQIDITVSNDRIGDLFFAHRMYDRAGPIFQENLTFRRSLLARSPNDRERKLAVAASLERMGDIRAVENNQAAARALFEESLALRRDLAAADPSSAQFRADVARTTNMVGDTYRNGGDLAQARRLYAESLAARRQLASADPSNALLTRDVGVSLQRVGMVEQMDNKPAEARAAWTEARVIFDRLAQADPSNGAFQELRTNTDELLRRLGAN